MKRKIVIVLTLAIIIYFSTSAAATTVGIVAVDMSPQEPSETDIITFDIVGQASSWPSEVGYDEFTQNGMSLQLDLYVDVGTIAMISDWTYEKQIGTLSAGTYSLEVRAFDNYDDTLQYTYPDPVYFTVVPEPATMVLLGLGGILMFKNRCGDVEVKRGLNLNRLSKCGIIIIHG